MAGEIYTALAGVSPALNDHPKLIRAAYTIALDGVRGSAYEIGFTGRYRVAGTTQVDGSPKLPVSRKVRLHDQKTGILAREMWSAQSTGVYSFDNIKAGVYYVVALDHTHAFNAVIASDYAALAM